MPNKDGTGPQGDGPKTGRGAGNCTEPINDDNSKEVEDDEQTCEDCGQGRGLKPCGFREASDVVDTDK